MKISELPKPSSKIVLERHVGNYMFRGEIHYNEDYATEGLWWYVVAVNGQIVSRGHYPASYDNIYPRDFIPYLDNRIVTIINDVMTGNLPSHGFLTDIDHKTEADLAWDIDRPYNANLIDPEAEV